MARKTLGFMQLTILCGFSLYYAWYLIAFFGFFLSAPLDIGFVQLHAGQALFFFGNAVALIVIVKLLRKSESAAIVRKPAFHIATFVPGIFLPGIALLGELGFYAPLPLFYVACFLTGTSIAFGFMLWEQLSESGYLNRGTLAHGTTFCAGGVIFIAAMLCMSDLQISALAIVLLIASTALLAFITPRIDIPEDEPLEPALEYFKGAWHLEIVIAVINTSFGFAFIALFNLYGSSLIAAMGIAVLVDLALSIVFSQGKWLIFTGWARICTAVASCALLLFVCPGDPVKIGSLCALVVLWFTFRTMNGGSLIDLANNRNYPILYLASRGNLSAAIGFALGLVVGLVAVSTGIPETMQFYVPLALVALFVITSLLFLPFGYESSTVGYKTLADRKSVV